MQNNMTLAVEFKGSVAINAVPVVLEGSIRHIDTKGGFIAAGNTNGTAIFGVVLSVNPAGDPAAFYVGIPGGYSVIGVLLNEQGIRENDPAKPTYIMNELPATAVSRGRLWYSSWTKTAAGAIDPVVGCRVICNNTTGKIEFLTAGGGAPGGWTQVQAAVLGVNTLTNGADIDFFIPVAT